MTSGSDLNAVIDCPQVRPSLARRPRAAVLEISADGVVARASSRATLLFGVAPVKRSLADFVPDPAPLWAAIDNASGKAGPVSVEGRRANGVPIALDVRVRRQPGDRMLCVVEQVDRPRPGMLDIAFDSLPIGMAVFNTDGEYVRVNAALCALLGRSADELVGMRDQALTHPDDRQSDVDAAWRILRGELDSWRCEKRFLRPDGTVISVLANLAFIRDQDGRPLFWVGQFQDVTALRRLASVDPLTDALNRRAFDAELERAIKSRRPAALLVLDLDGFKDVNDVHGHHAGDELLHRTATTIRASLDETDYLGRLGGDEFAVLLTDIGAGRGATVAAELARAVAEQRFRFDGVIRAVTTSIGLVELDATQSPAQALAAADGAMYDAKAVGGGRVRAVRR